MKEKQIEELKNMLTSQFNIFCNIINFNKDSYSVDFKYEKPNDIPVLFHSGIDSNNINHFLEFFNYLKEINYLEKDSISIKFNKDDHYNIRWEVYYNDKYIDKFNIDSIKKIYDYLIQEKKDSINTKINQLNSKITNFFKLIQNYLNKYEKYQEIITTINEYQDKNALNEKKNLFSMFGNKETLDKILLQKLNTDTVINTLYETYSIQLEYNRLFNAENIFSQLVSFAKEKDRDLIPYLTINNNSINNSIDIINIFKQLDRLNMLIDKKIENLINSLNEINQIIDSLKANNDLTESLQNKEKTFPNIPSCEKILNHYEEIPYQREEIKNHNTDDYYDKDLFAKIETEQSKILTKDEKVAVLLYKTQLYRAFNPLITLINKKANNDQELSYEMKKNVYAMPEFNAIVEKSYNEMKKQFEENKTHEHSQTRFITDDILPPDYLVSIEQYKEIVANYLPHLTTALQKVQLPEDLVVYRGVNASNDTSLNNGLLSTSIYPSQTLQFIENRPTNQKDKIIYKIFLPKGSPVICFTNEIFTGRMNKTNPFADEQKEILIDPNLFSFKLLTVSKGNNLPSLSNTSDKIEGISIVSLEAIPNEEIYSYNKNGFTK